MFHAINTLRNNKVFSSLKVFCDLSLQETDNNRWIVPESDILDYGDYNTGDEIELSYIKPQIRNYGDYTTAVAPHFRLNKKYNSVKLIKTNKLHNLVNNLIYDLLLSEDMKKISLVISEFYQNNEKKEFYKHKLSELDLDLSSIDYEVILISENNQKRADILIKFNKKHEIYGKGLCFEVQLSKQSDEVIEKRTYERSLLGLSTIWIFPNDYELINDKIVVKQNIFKICPYINVLNMHLDKSVTNIVKTYETQGILLDNKIDEFKEYLDKQRVINQKCIVCNKGYITIKRGKYGNFLGCSNYPNCKIILNFK